MFPADRYFYFITVTAENTALYKYSGQNGKGDSRTISERVTLESAPDPSQKSLNNSFTKPETI